MNRGMGRIRAFLPKLLVALSAVFAFTTILSNLSWRVDDAYIVARYAENLAQHGRLTWNLGDPPVEGFTGYTLLSLMTLASLLGAPPVEVASGVGIAALFVGGALVCTGAEALGASRFAGAVGASLYFFAVEQPTHAVSGLETELFMALTVGCALVTARRCHGEAGARPLWLLPLLVALCSFTRPEGAVIGGSFLLATLVRERVAWRLWLLPAVCAALPAFSVQVFRLAYFGSWAPNTYYAKLNKSGEPGNFVHSFANHAGGYIVPVILAVVVMVVVTRTIGSPVAPLSAPVRLARKGFLAGAIPSYGLVGASYLRSDLVMNYSERFAFHLFGLSCLLVVIAVSELERYFLALARLRAVRSFAFVLVALCLYLPFANALQRLRGERTYRRAYLFSKEFHYRPAARWLTEHLPPGATLAVYPDAGLVPYLTHLRTIDFGKLNDAYLAREARSSSDVIEYFFRQQPGALMIFFSGGLKKTFDKTGDLLLADPRFSSYYLAHLSLFNDAGTAIFVKR